jgi:polysaccharide biosynthesis transport protein
MNDSLVPATSTVVSVQALPRAHEMRSDVLTPVDIWRTLRKRKFLVIGCMAGSLLLAAAVSLLMPKRYEAVARAVVNPESSSALNIDAADLISGNGLNNDVVQQTQVRVLQSTPLIWTVIEQLRLDQKAEFAGEYVTPAGEPFDKVTATQKETIVENFRRSLRVQSLPKTQLIELRFRAREPKVAADAVNILTTNYIERTFRTRYEATMQASDWLSKQLDDLKARVEASQQRFTEYQKKSGIIGTEEMHNIFIVQLDELNRQLAIAQAERILREARYRVAVSGNPELIAEVVPTSTLAILHAQQVDLKNQYTQLTATYGNAYPRVLQLRSQLSEVEKALTAEVQKVRERLQTEFAAAQSSEQMLIAELDKQKQAAYGMNEAGVQFAILKRDMNASRDLYEGLQKKLKEAGIVAGLHSTNIDVIDPARVPIEPVEPRVPLNMAIGLILGTFGGIASAFLLENMDTTIGDLGDGSELVKLPVLGIVPRLRSRSNKQAGVGESGSPFVLQKPRSEFAEAFRALRTTLLLSSAGAPPKVIIVSSAAPNEGKSTASINCAVVLAQRERRVLLVDADLRRSGVQRSLRLKTDAGLSECLAGAIEPAAAIQQVAGQPNLDVLLAGHRPPNPVELLDSERMRDLLARWRQEYDHVIIDTPPLVGLSDALVISPLADAVLLVARAGQTSQQSLRRARDILLRINARTIGVIVNDVSLKSDDYYQYYGYYGSKYGDYFAERSSN